MSYVEKNLMTGETIEHIAKITWMIYLPSFFMFLLALFFIVKSVGFLALSLDFAFFGILLFINSFINRWTTELVVTSKRVIYKTGLISRRTIELNHLKVESFHLDQSIMGRLFDFGMIIINGTGAGKTPIPNIDSPLDFRRRAMEVIDPTQEFKK